MDKKNHNLQQEWANDLKIQQTQFDKQIAISKKQVELAQKQCKDNDRRNQEKIARLREHMKEDQKSIFEKIEKEYSPILKQKDRMIKEQAEQIEKLKLQLKEFRDNINSSKQRHTIEAEMTQYEGKRQLELLKIELTEESQKQLEREIRKQKEILSQEYEFKIS